MEAFVPRLWAYEIRNCILMGVRRARIAEVDALEFLDVLNGLRIQVVDPVSYDAIFQLASAHGLTIYDAAYLDLALREEARLACLDEAMKVAAGTARNQVVLTQGKKRVETRRQ